MSSNSTWSRFMMGFTKGSSNECSSEPVVSHAAAVSWQVFERVQPVKVVDGYPCHIVRLGEAKIHGDAAAPLFVNLLRAPESHTPANRAEVEFNRFASYVGASRSGDVDSCVLVIIGPQSAVASTYRAAASSRALGPAVKPPPNRAAMTGPIDHFSLASAGRSMSFLPIIARARDPRTSPSSKSSTCRNC